MSVLLGSPMRRIVLPLLLLLTGATAALAQTQKPSTQADNVIDYTPVNCLVADELTVLQMNVTKQGDLRAYFRFVNTPDWCWVQGTNMWQVSTLVMPKFKPGQEIEYFFVLLDKKRVIGKSPVVYRAKASEQCDTLIARHSINFTVDCTHEVSGSASSIIAGNGLKVTGTPPPHISPDEPTTNQ